MEPQDHVGCRYRNVRGRKEVTVLKLLIITVAGMSTRFSGSIGKTCVKCLYHENDIKESLLYQLLHQYDAFDRYIIVGGWRFEELQQALDREYRDLRDKIILVKNDFYEQYGSGYSLCLGLKAAVELHPDEIVFAEGDLFVDHASFAQITELPKPVITVNSDPIDARRSVVFYFDTDSKLHYLYDTGHNALEIREPFTEIHNSGQIWKFICDECFRDTLDSMRDVDWCGTNLVFVQNYFSRMERQDYGMIRFDRWINCNTIADFKKMQKEIAADEDLG